MGRYFNISRQDMDAFLTGQGFLPMTLPGTVELVYGKIVKYQNHRLSLRIYTAINPSGESRAKGSDAIRVQLYWMYNDKPTPVGRAQRCLRVVNWQKNLQAAIARCNDPENFCTCPKCGSPMAIRKSSRDGNEFWGCSTWHVTKCDGRPQTERPASRSSPNAGPAVPR